MNCIWTRTYVHYRLGLNAVEFFPQTNLRNQISKQNLFQVTYTFPSVFDDGTWMQQILRHCCCCRCTSRSKLKGHRLRGVVFCLQLYHPVQKLYKERTFQRWELDLLLFALYKTSSENNASQRGWYAMSKLLVSHIDNLRQLSLTHGHKQRWAGSLHQV